MTDELTTEKLDQTFELAAESAQALVDAGKKPKEIDELMPGLKINGPMKLTQEQIKQILPEED